MLNSILDNFDNVYAIPRDDDLLERLNIEKDEIDQIINFFTPFKHATDEVQAEKLPTLYLLVLWKVKKIKPLNIIGEENELLSGIKKEHYNIFKSYCCMLCIMLQYFSILF